MVTLVVVPSPVSADASLGCQEGATNPNSCLNANCPSGYSCHPCTNGWECKPVGEPQNQPTNTPPAGGGATVTPGGPPTNTPVPGVPLPTNACTVNCSGRVCGTTNVSCTSASDCTSGYTCENGHCARCTTPGLACCGYCVPQGWSCQASSCDYAKSCKAWSGPNQTGNLVCDQQVACAAANPCANAQGAVSWSCSECFEDCGGGGGGGSCTNAPAAVTNIQPAGTTAPGVQTITWGASALATSYYLAVDDTAHPWSCDQACNNCLPGDFCTSTTTNSKSSVSLENGHNYFMWVFAINDCGWSTITEGGVTVAFPTPTPTLAAPFGPALSCEYPRGPIIYYWNYPAIVAAGCA